MVIMVRTDYVIFMKLNVLYQNKSQHLAPKVSATHKIHKVSMAFYYFPRQNVTGKLVLQIIF